MNAMVGDPFLEDLQAALDHAARLGAQVEAMEEARKILFSELFLASKEKGVDAREHSARSDIAYLQATEELNKVRENAAIWKGKAQALQARIDVWRTRMASARVRSGG